MPPGLGGDPGFFPNIYVMLQDAIFVGCLNKSRRGFAQPVFSNMNIGCSISFKKINIKTDGVVIFVGWSQNFVFRTATIEMDH